MDKAAISVTNSQGGVKEAVEKKLTVEMLNQISLSLSHFCYPTAPR